MPWRGERDQASRRTADRETGNKEARSQQIRRFHFVAESCHGQRPKKPAADDDDARVASKGGRRIRQQMSPKPPMVPNDG